MIQLEAAVTLLGYVGVVSVAAERVVEMVKPLVDKYISDDHKKIAYYATAALSGGVLHTMSGQSFPYFGDPVSASVVMGLLASGGSGMWHELLGILRNFSSGVPTAAR